MPKDITQEQRDATLELTPRQAQAVVLLEVFIDLMHQLAEPDETSEQAAPIEALQREDIALLAVFFDRISRDPRPMPMAPETSARLARLLRLWAGTDGR